MNNEWKNQQTNEQIINGWISEKETYDPTKKLKINRKEGRKEGRSCAAEIFTVFE